MALAADDATDRVEQLIALTERLTEMLALDRADFEARRPEAVAPRAEEMTRLANVYRHESMRVKREPELVASAPAASRARLTKATQAFHEMLGEHARALAAAKTISEGMIQAIAQELSASRPKAAGYGPKARQASGGDAPLALNRQA